MSNIISSTFRKILGSGKAHLEIGIYDENPLYFMGDPVFFLSEDKEVYGRVSLSYPATHHYLNGREIDIVRMVSAGKEYGPVYSTDRRIRHATPSEIKERRKADRREVERSPRLLLGLEKLMGLAFNPGSQTEVITD